VKHSDLIEKLVGIEQSADVNAIRAGDVRFWPILRPVIWGKLTEEQVLPVQRGADRSAATYTHRSVEEEVWNGPRYKSAALTRLGRFGERWRRRLRHRVEADAVQQLAGTEALFWSRHHSYTDRFEGRFYNRHMDPLLEFVRARMRCAKVEVRSPEGLRAQPRTVPTTFLTPPLPPPGFRGPDVSGLDRLTEVARDVAGLDLTRGFHPRKMAASFEWRRRWFRSWLEIIRPQVLFMGGFFVVTEAALVTAARSLGITTVEGQHGRCGEWNAFFTHWTAIPQGGYEMMPDFFWAWGEPTKAQIENRRTDDFTVLKPIVGGHRWLAKWRDGRPFAFDAEIDAFLTRLDGFERVILYAFQTLTEPLPDHLVEAMRNAPPNWCWLLRLHPLLVADTEKLTTRLRDAGVRNFEIELPTKAPLFALLGKSHHHVTCSSSVALEASALGVPTSVLIPEGERVYRTQMGRGLFFYAPDADSLLRQIREGRRTPPDAVTGAYIETGDARATAALETILSARSGSPRPVEALVQ
jgi:hypothetical protein